MEDNAGTKKLIEQKVKEYAKKNPVEIALFREWMVGRQNSLKNKFAATSGHTFLDRAIMEIPEGLFGKLLAELPKSDMEFFKSKEGTRWFTNKFPLFSIPEVR